MDQHVSWSLPREELNLDTIWNRFEEFCKLQFNEVRVHFDLLTSFHQGSKSVDEWYNTVQGQVNLARYPPETAKILHHDIFWFFLKDEDFVSRTINEGRVDLQKFPASMACHLAKKCGSSKATTRHIRQVAGEVQAAQINLMCCQCSDLPNGKYKKRKPQVMQKQIQYKNVEQRPPNQYKKSFDPRLAHKSKDRCNKCGDSAHLEEFQFPAKKSNARHATSLAIIQAFVSRRPSTTKQLTSTANPKHIR